MLLLAAETGGGIGASLPWEQIGLGIAWPALLLIILAIVRGDLVSRKVHEDEIHEKDQWRTECRLKDQQLENQGKQINALLHEIAPTLTHYLEDSRKAANLEDRS